MSKCKSQCSVSGQRLAGGILLGSAVGATVAYFLSDSGKNTLENLANMCCTLSEQAQDLVEQVTQKSEEVSSDVSDYLFNGKQRDSINLNWIIGGVAASIIGLSAAAIISRRSQPSYRKKFLSGVHHFTNKGREITDEIEESAHRVASNFDEGVSSWVKIAQRVIDNINGCAKEACEVTERAREEIEDTTLDKVLDWAAFGIRIYQAIKK